MRRGPWTVKRNKTSPLRYEVYLTTFGLVAAYLDQEQAFDHAEGVVLRRIGDWTIQFAQGAALQFEVHHAQIGLVAAYDWPGRAEHYIEEKIKESEAARRCRRTRSVGLKSYAG